MNNRLMSFLFIKLNGTLSDILYQSSTAFSVARVNRKKLLVSLDGVYIGNVPMFNKMKQVSSLNCANCFYEKDTDTSDILSQIPYTRKHMEMVGSFKNKKNFIDNRFHLYWAYNFKIDANLEKSTYVYVNDIFLTNDTIFLDVIDDLINKSGTQVQVVIDSNKYRKIHRRINRRYLYRDNINILADIGEYDKLCVMLSCKNGGYYIGDGLGWWSYFFNITDNQSKLVEMHTYDKVKPTGNIFIVMPIYDDISKSMNTINQIMDQSYPYLKLFIIGKSLLLESSDKLERIIDDWGNDRIQYFETDKIMEAGTVLNYAMSEFINSEYWYFTYVSDENNYSKDYIRNLISLEGDFMYTGYRNAMNIDISFNYNTLDKLDNFSMIRSYVWSRNAINKISSTFTNLRNITETLVDYVAKSFMSLEANNIKYNNAIDMEYLDSDETGERISTFYKKMNRNKPLFLYYSKTPYKLLFQRPQQIARFMNNNYMKVFICKEDNVLEYEEKYNLFVISYAYKKILIDVLDHFDITIYFTDNRLLDEILELKKLLNIKLLYDLIDNPSEEFSVWKPNLERAVMLSDFVMYSHPKLLNTLVDVCNSKKYHYISNACDYEHFNKAKERIGKRPLEYGGINKKILGYYGAFAEWLDYDLIREYADKEEYHIIMIGGITDCASYNIRFKHPNITWLDHKSYDELPYYLSWFDVCFLPFRDCAFIKYVNPCKLWEYMASEKDIIKTGIDIECDKIITYTEVCDTIYDIITFGVNDHRVIKAIKEYDIKNETDYDGNSILFNSINNAVSNKTLNFSKPVIIVFSMIDYFFRIQRTQHLSHLCAKNGYTVFYLKTDINIKSSDNYFRELVPNLYEIGLSCKTDRKISVHSSILTKSEICSLTDSIERIQKKYNFKHFISLIANPFWLQVTNKINNTSIIYDCLDNTKEFKTHGDYIINLEQESIRSEYVMYTTPILKEVIDCQSKNYSIVRNGTEFSYFNSIKSIAHTNKRKVVGYYGAISDWWDVELVENMIKKFPNVDFHFIGNVSGNDQNHIKKIHNLAKNPNVKFFGEIPYELLSEYLKKFNVGIIPFLLNDLIKCTNPVKLYEMFSFGIPIVTTELLDVLHLGVDDICYISKDSEDFIKNIDDALSEQDLIKIEKRIEFAKNNSWQSRFEQFQDIMYKVAPPISIVLLCYNNWNITKRCIESVLNNSNYTQFEIIIVNNDSSDQTQKELNRLYRNVANIKIVHNKANYGFAIGMNIGALYAKYEYLILLNNDTVVCKDWLYPLVKPLILKNYSMGSPITNNCGNYVKQFIDFKDVNDLLMKAEKLKRMNHYKVCEIDRIPFFCPVLRKEEFYRVGLLDIKYKIGGWEDDDLIYKMKLYNNYPNYYTFASFVYHMESLTMSQMHNSNMDWSFQNTNKIYYETKWKTTWLSNTYKIPMLNNILLPWHSCDFFIELLLTTKKKLSSHIEMVYNKDSIIITNSNEDLKHNEICMKKIENSTNILLQNKHDMIEINYENLDWHTSIAFLRFINTALIMMEDN